MNKFMTHAEALQHGFTHTAVAHGFLFKVNVYFQNKPEQFSLSPMTNMGNFLLQLNNRTHNILYWLSDTFNIDVTCPPRITNLEEIVGGEHD